MPSTASISRWLKTSLTQNSEELIADEVPEPFILICRIETPHHRGTQKWLQCGAQNYGKDIKKTGAILHDTGSTFYASTPAGASTARLCYVGCLSTREKC